MAIGFLAADPQSPDRFGLPVLGIVLDCYFS
jgi:hypothetical protein